MNVPDRPSKRKSYMGQHQIKKKRRSVDRDDFFNHLSLTDGDHFNTDHVAADAPIMCSTVISDNQR